MREAAHLQRDQDPLCSDLRAEQLHGGDGEEEEDSNNMEDDETVSESALDGNTHVTLHLEEGERDGEAILRRLRVIREDAEHGAADDGADVPDRDEGGDGHHQGDRPNDQDESFEVETESPRSKYQRYLQSTIDEVSDVDKWTNIHYGFARDSGDELPEGDDSGCPTSRSRSRNSDNVPQPKTRSKPLAKAVARDVAQTVAMDMIEAIENS